MNILYVHGYGSTGNATKAEIMRQKYHECNILSPTIAYDELMPQEVQKQIRQCVEDNDVQLMVGSSLGGYHTLCATQWFDRPVWCINPVRNIKATLDRLFGKNNTFIEKHLQQAIGSDNARAKAIIEAYEVFDQQVFRQLPQRPGQINFALSTDDELLGSHKALLDLFPLFNQAIWKDNSSHRFSRFAEVDILNI